MWVCTGYWRCHHHDCRQWCTVADEPWRSHLNRFQFSYAFPWIWMFLWTSQLAKLCGTSPEAGLSVGISARSHNQEMQRHVEMKANYSENVTSGFALESILTLSDIPSCLVRIQEALCFAVPPKQCQNNAWSYYLTIKSPSVASISLTPKAWYILY